MHWHLASLFCQHCPGTLFAAGPSYNTTMPVLILYNPLGRSNALICHNCMSQTHEKVYANISYVNRIEKLYAIGIPTDTISMPDQLAGNMQVLHRRLISHGCFAGISIVFTKQLSGDRHCSTIDTFCWPGVMASLGSSLCTTKLPLPLCRSKAARKLQYLLVQKAP